MNAKDVEVADEPLDIKRRRQCLNKSTLGEVLDVLDVDGLFGLFDRVSCAFI